LGLPFPGFEPGIFIPKSHFIDRRLNHYTTASISAHLAEVDSVLRIYKGSGDNAKSVIQSAFARHALNGNK
jgi:hypothetical protein